MDAASALSNMVPPARNLPHLRLRRRHRHAAGRSIRHAFYKCAREVYAIVATSETALYANLILKKRVVAP